MNNEENNGCCGCLIIIFLIILFSGAGPALFRLGATAVMAFILLGVIGAILIKFGLIKMPAVNFSQQGFNRQPPKGMENKEEFIGVLFSSLGKLAKADGVVSQSEANQIKAFIVHLGLNDAEKAMASEAFKNACSNRTSFKFYIDELSDIFSNDPSVLQMILGLYCSIAISDGVLSQSEKKIIDYAEGKFRLHGYSQAFFQRSRNAESQYRKHANSHRRHSATSMDGYYAVLGCTASTSDVDLRKAYLNKCKEFHPDKIQGKGLPDEFKKFAEEELKKVNQAYDEIKKHRGL